MTQIEKLKQEFEELKIKQQNELDEIQGKIEQLESTKNERRKRWKPSKGEIYYYVGENGYVYDDHWRNYEVDNLRYSIGNVFQTEEEAEFEAERLRVIAKMREYAFDPDWDNDEQEKYFIVFSHWNKKIEILCIALTRHGDIFFKSKTDCQKCIDEVGDDNIKKYYFKVGD